MKAPLELARRAITNWRQQFPDSFKIVAISSAALVLSFIIWRCYDSAELERFCASHVLFPVVSFILAVVGIIFGICSLLDSYKQQRELENQYRDLELIAQSITTRYIGAFPNHLKDIINLVDKAQERFCYMTDCVDYGSFSHPPLHDKLLRTIERAITIRNIEVRMVVCGKPAAISRSSPFFWKTYEELNEDGGFVKCLRDYLGHHPEFQKPATKADFETMLMCHHDQVYSRLRGAGVKICVDDTLQNSPGLFFWMADDVDAVFLLSHTGAGTQELAFRTRDAKLIEIFKSTFERKHPTKEWNFA